MKDLRSIEEYTQRQAEVAAELEQLEITWRGRPFDEATRELYADLVEEREEIEEGWCLVAGLLLGYLETHGEGLGCGCGSPEWLERVILGEAAHG